MTSATQAAAAIGRSDRSAWPTDLESAARHELVQLWHDLWEARREAIDGVWSMRCDDTTRRISILTLLVGPTPYGEIDMDLLLDGTYQAIHEALGLPAEVDMDHVRKADERYRVRRRSS